MAYNYIQTENGIPSGSVFTLEQMQQKFPSHDFTQGPPANYALFEEPGDPPEVGKYQKLVIKRVYKKPGTEVFTQELAVKDMSPAERAAAIEEMKRQFYANTGYLSWTFDPIVDRWIPPKQPPNGTQVPDGAKFIWNEAAQEWTLQEI